MSIKRAMRSFLKKCFCFGLLVAPLASSVSANNVRVTREGSLLKVFGDNLANDVVVQQTSTGDILATGRNGTKVNGLASVRLRGFVPEAIEMRMEGGNDLLNLRGLRPSNDLFVNLGAGNDRLITSLPVSVGNNFAIEGGAGSDNISLTDVTVTEDLYIDGGIGALRVDILRLDGGKGLTVIGDAANDTVNISASMTADIMSIETKAGADTVRITDSMAFALVANTDMGADRIAVSDFFAMEDIGIFTGTENDDVDLVNVTSDKNLTVSVDAGSDMVSGQNVIVAEDAVFEGGSGFDVLEDLGIQGGTKFDVKEFESIIP
jgi:hypothetical protein